MKKIVLSILFLAAFALTIFAQIPSNTNITNVQFNITTKI